MKLRRRQILEAEYIAALSEFVAMQRESLTLLSVDDRLFAAAADFATRSTTGLRAGDALHLAIASDRGATICTLDKGMAKAAAELDLSF